MIVCIAKLMAIRVMVSCFCFVFIYIFFSLCFSVFDQTLRIIYLYCHVACTLGIYRCVFFFVFFLSFLSFLYFLFFLSFSKQIFRCSFFESWQCCGRVICYAINFWRAIRNISLWLHRPAIFCLLFYIRSQPRFLRFKIQMCRPGSGLARY